MLLLSLPRGLYWIVRHCAEKGVDHHALLDNGNCLGYRDVDGRFPVIIHQTPPSIRAELLTDSRDWKLRQRIIDEGAAIRRLHEACANPMYSALWNNCEHFVRYVATGVRESKQVQGYTIVAGLVAVTVAGLADLGRARA